MELMSSLLLCAVVAFPLPALGDPTVKYAEYGGIRLNSSTKFHPANFRPNNSRPTNFHSNPIVTNFLMGIRPSIIGQKRIDYFPSPFMDTNCKPCNNCMERAVKEFKYKVNKNEEKNERLETDKIREEFITSYDEVARDKRGSDFIAASKLDDMTIKIKKGKSKKTKVNKTVTVTKYNVDKHITAIKVKETQLEEQNGTPSSITCQVYSVKKSYPCDTPESDLILAAARRRVNKRSKKEKDKIKVTTSTETPKLVVPAFRKREVDNSQVPENFMPSIEDLLY